MKCWLIQAWVCGKNWPIVGGNASSAAAKMIGMTPAMFTRIGRYVDPPVVIRRPTCRFAYWIGIRRWPSWMNTTETITHRASSGKNSLVVGPPSIHARTASGARSMIDAKISSEMPLPIPRLVICSPNHISSVVPAVSVTTISTRRPVLWVRIPCRRNRYE